MPASLADGLPARPTVSKPARRQTGLTPRKQAIGLGFRPDGLPAVRPAEVPAVWQAGNTAQRHDGTLYILLASTTRMRYRPAP